MNSDSKILPISKVYLILLFVIPSIYFYGLTNFILPYLNVNSGFSTSVNWFICGFLIFIPLFTLALFLSYRDTYKNKILIFDRLRLKKITPRDWKYIVVSTLSIFLIMSVIMGVSKLLNYFYDIRELKTIPPFMEVTIFTGWERLYLLIWGLMFFFNIFGEELLWRGYILTRQEVLDRNKSWIINSFLWLLFHFALELIY